MGSIQVVRNRAQQWGVLTTVIKLREAFLDEMCDFQFLHDYSTEFVPLVMRVWRLFEKFHNICP